MNSNLSAQWEKFLRPGILTVREKISATRKNLYELVYIFYRLDILSRISIDGIA